MNTKAILLIGLLAASLNLVGCDSVDSHVGSEMLVVEAFLYAGEPVDDIRITRAIDLASEDTMATPVNGALVSLIRDNESFVLSQVGLQGHYAYLGDNLIVGSGDEFELVIEADGQAVSAMTRVPFPPENVVLSADVLEVPSFGGGGGPPQINNNYLTATWDNPQESLHYVVIESTEKGEPTYILPDFIRDRVGRFRLITRPTEANYYDINLRSLEVLGMHEVRVYRVNEEYADLYENRQQDSRDLNEPPTNIKNGLGVFSAFNSRSLEFEVIAGQ